MRLRIAYWLALLRHSTFVLRHVIDIASATLGKSRPRRQPEQLSPLPMIYTCPMHPAIDQDHPGACPKCGMTLEPKAIGAEDREDGQRRSVSGKSWIALGHR